MDVKMIDKLKDKLCMELEQVSRKTTMSSGDLDMINKLIVSIEKLMRIEEIDDSGYSEGRYSRRGGMWNANGSYGNRYEDGDSYANDYSRAGMHYVRGHYSRDDGREMIREELERRMQNANSNDRAILEKAMDILR